LPVIKEDPVILTTDILSFIRPISHCHFCGYGLTQKFIEGRSRLYCEACDIPIYQNPVPATCVVVIDEQDRLLLVKRSVAPKIGEWCLPGGFIELNEGPRESALRELKEETGLTGAVEHLLGVSSNPSAQYSTILMVGYLVRCFSGNLIAGDDAADAGWFSTHERPPIAFDSHRQFVSHFYGKFKQR